MQYTHFQYASEYRKITIPYWFLTLYGSTGRHLIAADQELKI